MARKNFKHSKGFTLIEIMIALGLVSGLMLAVQQMISTGQKGAKKISQDIEQASLSNTIIDTMRAKNSCEYVLGGVNLAVAAAAVNANAGASLVRPITKVIMNGAVPSYIEIARVSATAGVAADPKYGAGSNGAIYINSIKLWKYVAGAPTTPGDAYLNVSFTRVDNGRQMSRDVHLTIYDKNNNGTFDEGTDVCYSSQDFYVDASCRALGGTTDLLDNSLCKGLHLFEVSGTSDALTLNGNLVVQADPADPATAPGKITAADDITTAKNFVGNMLHLNTGNLLEMVAGTSTGAGPNIKLDSGAGAGVNAAATTFNKQDGTAGTAVTINGTSTLNGNTTITGVTNVTGATTINGTTKINGDTTITGVAKVEAISPVININAATTTFNQQSGALSGANVVVNGNLTVPSGAAVPGFMILNRTAEEIGSAETNVTRVVNKDWVYKLLTANLANNLSPSQKDAIVQYVLQQSALAGWLTLKNNINGSIRLLSSGAQTCGAGESVVGITWVPSTSTATAQFSDLSYKCAAPAVNNCSASGVCSTVYTNSSYCLVGGANCISNVKYDVWGVCYWSTSIGGLYAGSDPTHGNMAICPANYFAVGTGWNGSFAVPYCCPSANR